MLDLRTELIARVSIITLFYSIISYLVIQRHIGLQDKLEISIPLLFVTFGVVVLVNILYCLKRHRVSDMMFQNDPSV